MVLAFLIVVAGANPSILVPLSLLALIAIIISLKALAEDLARGLRAVGLFAWTEIGRVAGWIAYLATEAAALVREFLACANRAYIERVRRPLERLVRSVEARNAKTREVTRERLARQNSRHKERFGDRDEP